MATPDPCTRYLKHVVTDDDGLTPDNPFGFVSTVGDYVEWRALARRFLDMVEDQVDQHQAVLGASEWPLASAKLEERYAALPTPVYVLGIPSLPGGTDDDTRAMVQLTVDASCVLGQVDDELVSLGKKPSTVPLGSKPKTTGDKIEEGAKGLAWGAFILAALWIWRRGDG